MKKNKKDNRKSSKTTKNTRIANKSNNIKKNNVKINLNQVDFDEEIEVPDERKISIKRVVSTIFVIALFIGSGVFMLMSPVFNISSIEEGGNQKYNSNVYIRLSGLKKEENIFKFKKSDVISNIKRDAYVEDVHIKRYLPDKVKIEVEERNVAFIMSVDDGKYGYIDKNGYILEISEEKLEVPTLIGILTEENNISAGSRLDETSIERIRDTIQIQNSLKKNEIQQFDTIDISNKFNYILTFEKEVKKVYIGDLSDLDTKILYMKYILDEQEGVPGSIYLNESKIYFSPE